jgi:hypothetical protein
MSRIMDDQLFRYLLGSKRRTSPEGLGRKTLVIVPALAILVPIFLPFYALLVPFVLVKMGRKRVGLGYLAVSVASIAGLIVTSMPGVRWGGPEDPVFIFFAALFLINYIACWVHNNVQFSNIRSAAKQVIERIDRSDELRNDPSAMLEKGALLYKVLGDKRQGELVLENSIGLNDGDPYLLRFAGLVMASRKKPAKAVEFFRRALSAAKDQTLIAQLRDDMRRFSGAADRVSR